MKIELFKKLIKEAVREVIQEELSEILKESAKKAPVESSALKMFGEHKKVVSSNTPKVGVNPLMDILEQTKNSMTKEDYSHLVSPGFSQDTSLQSQAGNLHENLPPVGVDLSQLSFVKNAKAILEASNEKDKLRGGF